MRSGMFGTLLTLVSRDWIDFEPAGGDAHKMLLGSLDDKIDRKLNIVNSTVKLSVAPPVSPHSRRSSFVYGPDIINGCLPRG